MQNRGAFGPPSCRLGGENKASFAVVQSRSETKRCSANSSEIQYKRDKSLEKGGVSRERNAARCLVSCGHWPRKPALRRGQHSIWSIMSCCSQQLKFWKSLRNTKPPLFELSLELGRSTAGALKEARVGTVGCLPKQHALPNVRASKIYN